MVEIFSLNSYEWKEDGKEEKPSVLKSKKVENSQLDRELLRAEIDTGILLEKEIDQSLVMANKIKSYWQGMRDETAGYLQYASNPTYILEMQDWYSKQINNLEGTKRYIDSIRNNNFSPYGINDISVGISSITDIRKALEVLSLAINRNSLIYQNNSLKIEEAKIAGIPDIAQDTTGIKTSKKISDKTLMDFNVSFGNTVPNFDFFLNQSLGAIRQTGTDNGITTLDSISFGANLSENIASLCGAYSVPVMKDGKGNLVFSAQYLKELQTSNSDATITSAFLNLNPGGFLTELNLGTMHSLTKAQKIGFDPTLVHQKLMEQYIKRASDGVHEYISGESFALFAKGKLDLGTYTKLNISLQNVTQSVSEKYDGEAKDINSFQANTQLIVNLRQDLVTSINTTLKDKYKRVGVDITKNLDQQSNLIFYGAYEKDRTIVEQAISKGELGLKYSMPNYVEAQVGFERINDGVATANAGYVGLNFKYEF